MMTGKTLLAMAIVLSLALSFSANAVEQGDVEKIDSKSEAILAQSTEKILQALETYEALTKKAESEGGWLINEFSDGETTVTLIVNSQQLSLWNDKKGTSSAKLLSKKGRKDKSFCYLFEFLTFEKESQEASIFKKYFICVDEGGALHIEPDSDLPAIKVFLAHWLDFLVVPDEEGFCFPRHDAN